MATYAPLFAHVEGWQWRPDLIWFDNLNSVRTPNWYVQMLYGTNKGTNVLKLTENGSAVKGDNGLYASAVLDKNKKQYIVKIGNSLAQPQTVSINLKGAKKLTSATQTLLTAKLTDTNDLQHPDNVKPVTKAVTLNGSNITVTLPAQSFSVFIAEE